MLFAISQHLSKIASSIERIAVAQEHSAVLMAKLAVQQQDLTHAVSGLGQAEPPTPKGRLIVTVSEQS
jgi:hypothetical protein